MHSTLHHAAQQILQAGCENAVQEVRWLWQQATGRHWSEGVEAEPAAQQKFHEWVARRCKREPLAQIIGHQPFWSLDFYVNQHSLTPRSDSEIVVEAALAQLPETQKPYRLLDLGTGTGCLLLTLLHERPLATGVGVDVSDKALAVAAQNTSGLGLDARVSLRLGNWTEGLTGVFDLIISNPPYIPEGERESLMPEVRDYEPQTALFGGADGLRDYRLILSAAPEFMAASASLVLELGIGQAEAVRQIAHHAGLKWIETRRDLGGIERAIIFRKGEHAAAAQ